MQIRTTSVFGAVHKLFPTKTGSLPGYCAKTPLRRVAPTQPSIFGRTAAPTLSSRWYSTHGHKKDIAIANMRNIGIIAHIDAGKTTTTERMLHYAGFTRKIGDVDTGDTIMDYMKQERERGITITSAAITFGWHDHKINLIDTPGHVDFTIEVERAIRVLDGAVTILDAVAGVEAQTETVWQQADRHDVARIAFVNKMDRAGAGFGRTVREMRTRLGCRPVVVQIPLVETVATSASTSKHDAEFNGVVDIVTMETLRWDADPNGTNVVRRPIDASYPDKELYQEAVKARMALVEQLAALDETIVELFLTLEDHMAIEPKDIKAAIRRLTLSSTVVPVLCGASFRNIGVQPLLDAVVDYLPSPVDRPAAHGRQPDGDLVEIGNGGDKERLCALAFKVIHDARRGPMVFVRVYAGQLNERVQLWNSTTQSKERANKLLQMYAMDVEEIPHISKGNIGVILGLKETRTGDTLLDAHDPRKGMVLSGIKVPSPVFFASVEPMSAADEKPVEEAIKALIREDPSLGVRVDEETGQTLLGGMGELHLEVAQDRLTSDFKVKAEMGRMRISFKETMRGAGTVSSVPKMEYDREILGKRAKARVGVTVERLAGIEDGDAGSEDSSAAAHEAAAGEAQNKNNKGKGKKKGTAGSGPATMTTIEEHDGNEIFISLQEPITTGDEAGVAVAMERAAAEGVVIPSGTTDMPLPVLRSAVKNGMLSALSRGPLLGFAQTHLRVRLTDVHLYGPESTPAAVSSCVASAVTEAIRQGGGGGGSGSAPNSVLLEPIMDVRVEVADKDVGTVVGDISGTRRGRVQSLDGHDHNSFDGQDEESEFQLYAPPDATFVGDSSSSGSSSALPGGLMADRKVVRAQVPLSSMVGYDSALRALTGGTGKFAMEVIGYGEMDFDRQRDVIKEMRGG
ncbi:Ribosome-releasing factor 2, mitochondrial [Actinomortierella ambigua]|nr:Ribosome-releasing factor 2, mitochondrial [Actinomortierella ambigua]